jgi:7-cyano-7-deazaguanine synthase in queuosine biosynthesis
MATGDRLAATLSFLSGDHWQLKASQTDEPPGAFEHSTERVDAVCLFSGGLDSFAGAVDLLATGKRVCLVAHHEGGQAPGVQMKLVDALISCFGAQHVLLRRLFLRPASAGAGQTRPLAQIEERSMRARSVLFICAGLAVASSYGNDVPLFMPENGFIGLNVPLTLARTGTLSTRTTHPHFVEEFGECAVSLGIANPIINPFRLLTKGEVLEQSGDTGVIRSLARETLSCAHPEAARFAGRAQGNCGYCLPCLIRRGALYRMGLDKAADYSFDVLSEEASLEGDRGSDLRCLLRALSRPAEPVDVLRNGPLPSTEISAFLDVYERGRREILTWLRESDPSDRVSRQLGSA